MLISAIPVSGSDGNADGQFSKGPILGTRGIAIDVTEERRRQGELARLKIRDRMVTYIVDALRNEVSPPDMLRAAATALGRACSASCTVQVRGPKGEPLAMSCFGKAPPPDRSDRLLDTLPPAPDVAEETAEGYRYLGIATAYRGGTNGAIVLWRAEDDTPFEDEERSLIKAVEPQFGVVFRQIADQQSLERLSRTDELTGLRNRRAFMEDLSRELSRDNRIGGSGALLFVDLDNFKPINDRFGHERGDETLRAVAEMLDGATRRYDLVCRLGGDEFAVWLEGAGQEIASARAEHLLAALDTWKADALGADSDFGMSIGVAVSESTGRRGSREESAEGLIARADAAMYEAKKDGKNRLVFAPTR